MNAKSPLERVSPLWLGIGISAMLLLILLVSETLLGRWHAPFTQQGLSNALLVVDFASISSLMLFESGFDLLMLVLGSMTLLIAVLSLFAPVWGVHKRILQEKQLEVAWLDREIMKLRDTLPDSKAVRQSGEMADLISYPLSTSTNAPRFTQSPYNWRRLGYHSLKLLQVYFVFSFPTGNTIDKK